MATINEIKQQAAAVKNATQVGENTADRVGGALAGLADIAEQQDSKLNDLGEKIDGFNQNDDSKNYLYPSFFVDEQGNIRKENNDWNLVKIPFVGIGEEIYITNTIGNIYRELLVKDDKVENISHTVSSDGRFFYKPQAQGTLIVGGFQDNNENFLNTKINRSGQFLNFEDKKQIISQIREETYKFVNGMIRNSLDNYANVSLYYKSSEEPSININNNAYVELIIDNVEKGDIVSIPNIGGTIVHKKMVSNGTEIDLEDTISVSSNRFIVTCPNNGTIYWCIFGGAGNDYTTVDFSIWNIVHSSRALMQKDVVNIHLVQAIFNYQNHFLKNKNIYTDFIDGPMFTNGEIDETQVEYFKHTDRIKSTNPDSLLMIECNLGAMNDHYSNVIVYDEASGLICAKFNLFGKHLLCIPMGLSIVITIPKNDYYYVKYGSRNDISEHTFETDDNSRKNVVWLGTSIPAGAGYPEDVFNKLGYNGYNRAYGGSSITWNSSNPLNLSMTIAEKQQYFPGDDAALQTSYENRLIPYINGTICTADAIIFDHGYNDEAYMFDWFVQKLIEKGKISNASDLVIVNEKEYHSEYIDLIDESWIDWNDTTKTSFFGAFVWLKNLIQSYNPYCKIIIVSHLEDGSCRLDNHGKSNGLIGKLVCKVQEIIAKHYGFYFVDMCNMTGWSKWESMPNSAEFIKNINEKYGTNYYAYWLDEKGNISTFQYFCPDGVHPQSDKSKKTRPYLSSLFIKAIKDVI